MGSKGEGVSGRRVGGGGQRVRTTEGRQQASTNHFMERQSLFHHCFDFF